MSRQKRGLFSTLAAVGAVGAVAGLAWRWAQRHRGANALHHRDLSRWEGEGGALAASGQSAPQNGAPAPAKPLEPASPEMTNGATATPWPFPHGTRH
ncbi:hypothetical protein [Paraburkholderia caballeronis]|uniref:Uncharacterized protein n=1 Tax=Paraburkholderia caballeronis TaxID=416943 RepID=A0A1H7W1I3_9BURK|nr:hypothetical protein [Paraburkholderia caballeronis]PXW22782.1 hypothetical protein C7403_113177 [Paraburkholderia caballeronis]PXW96885.1 hypothetical protein C7407_113177 [Paraburkholderia caballeronis]RAJ93512.1 hypothetical protein C7409_113177 [Paraburkholderia caballeronis]TDV12234.1 hypothetical protein C7408_110175 [Paraburkholderia caballeronis]TDV15309.1 hypothetical protein C7406_111175 [Paraburkholderia caballeronis]